jgi:uncharacterized membrane protein YbhN (UPF0104 family)
LLPVGALSAAALASRLLSRYGIGGAVAAASIAVDLAAETAGQVVFLICGIALVPIVNMSRQSEVCLSILLLAVLGMCGSFVVGQRIGLFRLLDIAAERLKGQWPKLAGGGIENFHEALMTLHAQRRRLANAVILQSLSWGLGAVEVSPAFHGLGHTISWRSAFVVVSIGMAARSAGFALPAGIGIQEGGFVLGARLVGIPPELAVACSFLTRGRELLVAATSLVVLGREELRVFHRA